MTTDDRSFQQGPPSVGDTEADLLEEAVIKKVSHVLLEELFAAVEEGVRGARAKLKARKMGSQEESELNKEAGQEQTYKQQDKKQKSVAEMEDDDDEAAIVATAVPASPSVSHGLDGDHEENTVHQLQAELNELKARKLHMDQFTAQLLGFSFGIALLSPDQLSKLSEAMKKITKNIYRSFALPPYVTPLQLAAFYGDANLCHFVLDKANNKEVKKKMADSRICGHGDVRGVDAFALAVFEGHNEVVKVFLEHECVDPCLVYSLVSPEGTLQLGPPLCLAVMQGHEDVVRTLIGHGADVNEKVSVGDRFNGGEYPPIALAVVHNDDEAIVKLLIEHDAIVNVPCTGGTALDLAMRKKNINPKMVAALERAGARSGNKKY